MNLTEKTTYPDWQVLWIAYGAMILSAFDTSIITSVLPFIQKDLQTSTQLVTWGVTGYVIAVASTIVFWGKLSDKFGRINLLLLGYLTFLVGSIICIVMSKVGFFITGRIIQGLGAAMLQGTAIATVTVLTPEERHGHNLGGLAAAIALGLLLGPVVGGFLISFAKWEWVFLINIPLVIILAWPGLVLKKYDTMKHKNQINMPATILLIIFLLAFFTLISGFTTFTTPTLITLLITSLVFSILFFITNAKNKEHLIQMSLFKHTPFSVAILGVLIVTFLCAFMLILIPYQLHVTVDLPAWGIGLVMLFFPLGLGITSVQAGKFLTKNSPNKMMLWGIFTLFIAHAALWLITLLGLSHTGLVILDSVALLLFGLGEGLFFPANTKMIMANVETRYHGTIGAFSRMISNMGLALGAAVSGAVFYKVSTSNITNNTILTVVHLMNDLWFVAFAAITSLLIIYLSMILIRKDKEG